MSQHGWYELFNGAVLERPAGERQSYGVVRSNISSALIGPVKQAGGRVTCGTAVCTGRASVRFPAAVVDFGPADPNALEAMKPAMVLEISSPTLSAAEVTDRLDKYWAHRSFRLVLLVDPETVSVKLYRRRRGGGWKPAWFDDLKKVVDLPKLGRPLHWRRSMSVLVPRRPRG